MDNNNIIYFKPAPQIENTGDLLINKSELDLLRNYGKVIIDDSKTPDWFINEIYSPSVDSTLSATTGKSMYRSIINRVLDNNKSKSDQSRVFLVIHPGHRSRQGFKFVLRTLYSGIKDQFINRLGVKLIRAGFSIGPYDYANGRMDSLMSYNYHYFGLRDNKSLKLANDLKFNNPQYFPDLAWAYQPALQMNEVLKEDYILISLRSNQYGEHHSEAYLKPIADKLRSLLLASGNTSRIVISYQVKYDREASIYLKDLLSKDFETELIDHKLSLSEAELVYSKARYVISNRLHVLLLAFQCDTLSIPYIIPDDNKKIVGIYADNKMDELMLDSNKEPKELSAELNAVIDKSAEYMDKFRKAANGNTTLIKEKLHQIFRKS